MRKHKHRDLVHKMLEEQLRKKFEEQKEQIANKIREVEEGKKRLKQKMDFAVLSGSANLATKLEEEVK